MVDLITTGEALELFKSRVTLKQFENKIAVKVYQHLQEADSIGSGLVLIIPEPRLNKQGTALLGHWIPTVLDEALIQLEGLIPTTVGWLLPATPPTIEEMVKVLMEPVKKIIDKYADRKANHPEELAQFDKNWEQAELDQMQGQSQEPQTTEP